MKKINLELKINKDEFKKKLNIKDGEPGANGSPDTGQEIVRKINELSLEPSLQIDAAHIKNLVTVLGGGGGGGGYARHYAKYYRSSNQTGLTVGGETTVDWDVTGFDTDPSWYNSTTKRWTPTLAGKYKVVFQVVWASTSAGPMGDFTEARIYRGGTVVANNGSEIGFSVYGDSLQIVAMITMNGTTDYLEWKILSPGACVSPLLYGGLSLTYTTMEYLGT